jgi:hypothetical protein
VSPIRPEMRQHYPLNWRAISRRIRFTRAEGRCECRGECGLHRERRCMEIHGQPATWARGKVVLTVAHMDHDPRNCADDNLRAMCQRCHLLYDREHHRETRQARAR